MFEWLKRLVADADNIPDEARVAFLVVQAFYLLVWAAWVLDGHLAQWPDKIAAFSGGEAGILTAFGVALLARQKN